MPGAITKQPSYVSLVMLSTQFCFRATQQKFFLHSGIILTSRFMLPRSCALLELKLFPEENSQPGCWDWQDLGQYIHQVTQAYITAPQHDMSEYDFRSLLSSALAPSGEFAEVQPRSHQDVSPSHPLAAYMGTEMVVCGWQLTWQSCRAAGEDVLD